MIAALWMLGTLLSFCLMAVGVRELSGELSVFQTLFFRSVISLLVISFVIFMTAQANAKSVRAYFCTSKLKQHTFRNVFHFGGQFGWFWGLGLLPLAEVFALEFTVPIWTLIIATLFLGESITPQKLLSIGLGMVGVLVIVQPGIAIIDSASLIVLAAAICYAISHTATKSLSTTEAPLTILFYMCIIQLPIALGLSWSDLLWPNNLQWMWLTVIGLTALTAHFCMTKAMQTAEVTMVVTMDFLRLPFIAAVGIWVYSEQFELSLMIGGGLMLLGNLVNVKRVTS